MGALLALAGCAGGEGAPKRTLPADLPDVTLAGFAGGPELDLAEVRGPAVINLWASWCGPCRTEMPILEKFFQAQGDRVQMIGVDFQDNQTQEAEEVAADTGVTYPLYADFEGQLAEPPLPRLKGLPYLLFVDADGQVVAWEAVIIKSVEELEELVAEHLDVEAA